MRNCALDAFAPDLLDHAEMAAGHGTVAAAAFSVCSGDSEQRRPGISICSDDGDRQGAPFSVCADDGGQKDSPVSSSFRR